MLVARVPIFLEKLLLRDLSVHVATVEFAAFRQLRLVPKAWSDRSDAGVRK